MNLTADRMGDALLKAYKQLLASQDIIDSSRGKNREIVGVTTILTNPLARLSLAESRATLFSCLGEFLWYLARSEDLKFVEYYVPAYPELVQPQGDKVVGAYGPRLFNWERINQVKNIIALIGQKPVTRQAAIQLIDRADVDSGHPDVPCTCTLQFLRRHDRLELIVMMRSNDAYRGFPHDVFAFTMLQELVARSLGIGLGSYRHWVGSFHLYLKDEDRVRRVLGEGWQTTRGDEMPSMPTGDQWAIIEQVLEAEEYFRTEPSPQPWPSTGAEYWDDIISLLEIYRHIRNEDAKPIGGVQRRMNSRFFDPFIDARLAQLAEKGKND